MPYANHNIYIIKCFYANPKLINTTHAVSFAASYSQLKRAALFVKPCLINFRKISCLQQMPQTKAKASTCTHYQNVLRCIVCKYVCMYCLETAAVNTHLGKALWRCKGLTITGDQSACFPPSGTFLVVMGFVLTPALTKWEHLHKTVASEFFPQDTLFQSTAKCHLRMTMSQNE